MKRVNQYQRNKYYVWPSDLTPEQVAEFKQMHAAGLPYAELSNHFNLAWAHSASQFAKRLGLPRRFKGKTKIGGHHGLWSAEEEELVCYLYHAGESLADICTALARTDRSIQFRINEASTKYGHRAPRGLWSKDHWT